MGPSGPGDPSCELAKKHEQILYEITKLPLAEGVRIVTWLHGVLRTHSARRK